MSPLGTTLLSAVISLLLTTVSVSASMSLVQDGLHVPCTFTDTVNLTDSVRLPNGSYVFQGVVIPPNLTGEYNYVIGSSLEMIPVKAHIRGCVCKIKPCVQLCCPPDQMFDGHYCNPTNQTVPMETNITSIANVTTTANISEVFALQIAKPCSDMYALEPWRFDGDDTLLFENGTLFLIKNEIYLSNHEYCIGSILSEDNVTDVLTPYNCFQKSAGETKYIVYAWMMLFSVPFILITICVYIGIPELRTLHGKSLCCYLLNLAIGYCVLSTFSIVPQYNISEFNCSFWGFTAYFCFMSSFFWLSVISFDLFYNIRAPRGRFNEKKRFLLYCIYSWGLAFCFLMFTWCAQNYFPISERWKPAIGGAKYCWLDVRDGWSAFAYFYGPIVIILCFNITMFVLTALQINSVQREMNRMMERNDSQRNLRTEKDRFGIFLRLFIVMGVTWSMEIISYCIGEKSTWNKLFYITDLLNGIQGFLIFALFVLKKKVKQYITNSSTPHESKRPACVLSVTKASDQKTKTNEGFSRNTNHRKHPIQHHPKKYRTESKIFHSPSRYQSTSRRERQSQYSNKTTSSSINLPLNGMGSEKPLMDKCVKINN